MEEIRNEEVMETVFEDDNNDTDIVVYEESEENGVDWKTVGVAGVSCLIGVLACKFGSKAIQKFKERRKSNGGGKQKYYKVVRAEEPVEDSGEVTDAEIVSVPKKKNK